MCEVVKTISVDTKLPEDFNDCMVVLLGAGVDQGNPPNRGVDAHHIQQLRLIRKYVSNKACISEWILNLEPHGCNYSSVYVQFI